MRLNNRSFMKEHQDQWDMLIEIIESEREGKGISNLELIMANALLGTFNKEFIDSLAQILIISNKRR